MTPEEREAVRALIAALPKCGTCGKPATRYDDTGGESEPREHYCDKHGEDLAGHDHAPALRKLQAMLDPRGD